jgi:uncharacterized protein YrrD
MHMKFKEGADVFTHDGKRIGSIDRVVLDPETKEVTHLVVREGFLLTTDKVIPLSLVGPATEERVTLREDAADVEALPDFEEAHYIPAGEADTPEAPLPVYARTYYWYPPASYNWGSGTGYGYPIPPYVVRTERHIPEGTVALEEGAKVLSRDGHHLGNVEEILTDPEQDRATHLVISRGVLLKERKLIPTTWVSLVLEDEVHLHVRADVLDRVPAYHPEG